MISTGDIVWLLALTAVEVLFWRLWAERERVSEFPVVAAFSVAYFVPEALFFSGGNMAARLFDVGVAAAWGSVLWDWWRRKRKGKPSRVLGLVKDLGHKLATVNIPAEVGTK